MFEILTKKNPIKIFLKAYIFIIYAINSVTP